MGDSERVEGRGFCLTNLVVIGMRFEVVTRRKSFGPDIVGVKPATGIRHSPSADARSRARFFLCNEVLAADKTYITRSIT